MRFNILKEQFLLEFLSEAFPDSSRRTLRQWLQQERVLVNEKVVKAAAAWVKPGDGILLLSKRKPVLDGLEILYDDSHIAVVEKAHGLLTVGVDGDMTPSVHGYLKRYYPKKTVYPVHRIDRETSGIIIFALSEKARDLLKKTFFNHDLLREYEAVVEGRLGEDRGTLRNFLLEDPKTYRVYVHESGKEAITHFEVVKRTKKRTYLSLRLETGRKHQIRVQLAHSGYPVVGDPRYGKKGGRMLLHARRLEVNHPLSGKLLSFVSRESLCA